MTFQEILEQYGVDYKLGGTHHHVQPGFLGVDCPFCGTNQKFHLGYSLSKHYVTCWICGYHSLFETLLLLLKQPKHVVSQLLQEMPIRRPSVRQGASSGPGARLVLPNGLTPLSSAHKRYLRGRGLDPEEVERVWGVQGIGMAPTLAWRLFIPVTKDGKTVSWTTRALAENAPRRYLNARPEQEIQPIKSVLFGADLAQQSILICEGPMDAMRIGPGAVSTLGLGYTRKQLREMVKFPKRLVCFDNETKAQQRAERLAKELAAMPGETGLVEIDAKDPGSASEEELQQLRRLLL